jgi:hypothetical protein
MAKRAPKPKAPKKRPTDVTELGHFIADKLTSPEPPKTQEATADEISRVMSALGRRGGKIGGKKRLETMTQKERSDVAFKAARARWDKAKPVK